MASFKHLISLIISVIAFMLTFYAMGKFMVFLSKPGKVHLEYTWILNLLDNKSKIEAASGAVVTDILLVQLFIFQHSFMKWGLIKTIFQKIKLDQAERAIYTLSSALCLWTLVHYWKPAPTITLWQLDIEKSNVLWIALILIHVAAWSVVYGGSIIMDLPEILGIKQVYYDMLNYNQPMAYKSFELRHLYGHVRHPSFSAMSIILWFTNVMTLDRFLLALLLTTYMYVAWSTDHDDMIYHKCQFQRKRDELKRMAHQLS